MSVISGSIPFYTLFRGAHMSSQLGLVCITHSEEVRYRTITRKRLLQHESKSQIRLLQEIYRDNLQRLDTALHYCERQDIALYRIPSGIFPFLDEPVGMQSLDPMLSTVARIGKLASDKHIRLVMHPDQFVVLNSDSSNVVANSIKILKMHADIMDFLQQPRSPWALIEIHGGKSSRSNELIGRIGDLPDAIRSRLGLENDEYAYSAQEIYDICVRSGVPMVFDAHHHVVHEKLSSYDDPSVGEMLSKARLTWGNPEHQLVHISNGKTAFGDREHADLIETMPSSYAEAPWIEIEAKFKEKAIQKLRHSYAGLQ
jgi:UV DNA damage endonuclease